MRNLVLRSYLFVSRQRFALTLALLMLTAVGLAQSADGLGDVTVVTGDDLNTILDALVTQVAVQLQGGAGLLAVLTSAPILAAIIGILAGYSNYYLTQTVKSYTRLKGLGTKVLAMFFSVLLGGVLGYFGLLESGAEGAQSAWAGVSLLIAWTIGEAKHENKELKRTGMRKIDRLELTREKKAGIADIAVEGLVLAAAPLGIPAATIRAMYEMFGREKVLELIAATRALTQEEMTTSQDVWEQGGSAPAS